MRGQRKFPLRATPLAWQASRFAFTLIELLVVVSIIAVVIGVVAASLAGGLRVWERAQGFHAGRSQARLTIEMMERDFMNSFPFYDIPFEAEPTRVRMPGLVRPADPRGRNPGMRPERIGLVQYKYDPAMRSILKTTMPYPLNEREASTELIANGVEGLRMWFLMDPGDSGTPIWEPGWNYPTNTPAGVRLEIRVMDDGGPETIRQTILMPVWRVDGKAGSQESEGEGQ